MKLKNMRPLRGKVICRVDFEDKFKITFGTLRLDKPPSWEGFQEHQQAPEWGFVHSLPEDYTGVLHVGDKVWGDYGTFQKLNLLQVRDDGTYFDYVLCEEDWIHVIERNGELLMMPDKFMGKELFEKDNFGFGLVRATQKLKANQVLITHVSEGESDVCVGDTMYILPSADYDIEINGERRLIVYDKTAVLGILAKEAVCQN